MSVYNKENIESVYILNLIKENLKIVKGDFTVAFYECCKVPERCFGMRIYKNYHIVWGEEFRLL